MSGDNAEWRAVSPFGLVPVLRHKNFVLAESNAIIEYLDALASGTLSGGPTLEGRALVRMWVDVSFSLAAAIRPLFFRQCRGLALTDAQVREAEAETATWFLHLEAQLCKTKVSLFASRVVQPLTRLRVVVYCLRRPFIGRHCVWPASASLLRVDLCQAGHAPLAPLL